jgi:hypothetical protein
MSRGFRYVDGGASCAASSASAKATITFLHLGELDARRSRRSTKCCGSSALEISVPSMFNDLHRICTFFDVPLNRPRSILDIWE